MRAQEEEQIIKKAKQQRIASHDYVSPEIHALVPAKAVGKPYSCQRVCFQRVSDVDILGIFKESWNGWQLWWSSGSQRV